VYIRSKTAKGQTYFQVVEGVRDGARVRQRIVVSLGRTPDPAAALKGMRGELARLRRERNEWPSGCRPDSKTLAHRLERLDVWIGDLETSIGTLAEIIKKGLVGTTPIRKDG
jgi:hypothetical protein